MAPANINGVNTNVANIEAELQQAQFYLDNTTMKAPDYLAINPMGKVPALRHGETVISEAAAICAYLADAFPTAGLAPPHGHRLRGPYYRWLFFASGPLEAVMSRKTSSSAPSWL